MFADITSLEQAIAKSYPAPVRLDAMIRPLQQAMARQVRLPLLILMGAVSAVMLIVCINLMNLMTVRAIAQRREWAIRLAIGAGLRHLLSSALVETLLLCGAGAALGSVLALWLLKLVQLKAPFDLPRVDELALDPAALLFAFTLAIASARLFSIWPAWRASRIDPQEALQSSSRSATEGRKGRWAGQALVAAEVALSTVLLLSAGLLLRSFVAILNVNTGVDVHHMLTVRIDLPPEKYKQQQQLQSFYQQLQRQVRAMPGVEAAGFVSDLPLTGESNSNPVTAGDRPEPPLAQWVMSTFSRASSGYFQAAGIPLEAGHVFEQRQGQSPQVLISANLAARLWLHENAVGRPIKMYRRKPLLVAGVVGSVHAGSLTQPASMMVYLPDWQETRSSMSLVVRTQDDPENLSRAIRRAILQLEPEAAIPSIQTMRQIVSGSLAQNRFQLVLLIGFAAVALVLASLGIYGMLAFATSRRTPEIGVRMALGARPVQILNMTVRGGMAPVVAGIAAGLAAAAACARILQNLLFEVTPLDPVAYIATCVVLLWVAGLATFIPARRAAAVDPMIALRYE